MKNRYRMLSECLSTLGGDYSANVDFITRRAGEILGAACALYNRMESGMLCSLGMWSTPPDYNPVDSPEGHVCYDIIKRPDNGPFVVTNLQDSIYYRTDPAVRKYGLRTYIGHSVFCGGKPVGSLCVVYVDDYSPTDDDVNIISIMASALAGEETRRSAAEAAEDSEKRYHDLFEHTGSATLIVSEDGLIEMMNAEMEAFTGYRRDQVVMKKQWSEFVHPDDLAMAAEYRRARLEKGAAPKLYELRVLTASGVREAIVKASLMPGTRKTIVAALDVTEYKKASLELRTMDENYKTIVDNIQDTIYIYKPDGIFKFVSDSCKYLGYEPYEMIGRNFFDFVHREDRDLVLDAYTKLTCEELEFPIVMRFTQKNGDPLVVENKARAVRGPDGAIVHIIGILHNITGIKRMEEQLRFERERFERAITAGRVVIWEIHHEDSRIFTDGLGELYGHLAESGGEDLSAWIERVVHPEDRDLVVRSLADIAAGLTDDYGIDHRIIRADGTEGWIKARGRAIRDAAGSLEKMVGTSIDITELKLVEEELEKARRVAEDAARAKSQFLANMSHEIRTPMNGIIGFANLLRSTPMSAEQGEFTDIIVKSSNSLLAIINDVLDFSKLEAGKMKLDLSPADLRAELFDVMATFRLAASAKMLSLSLDLDQAIGYRVACDAVRLKQIFMNLLSNSLKFTDHGGITVTVRQVENDGATATLRFAVTDTGIGIPADKTATIFEIFYQLDGSTTKKYQGTGLGLAIVKSLVEAMGGRISVESVEGKGSSFVFMIPFQIVREERRGTAVPEAGAHHEKKAPGLSLLLAEDDPINAVLMTKMIKRYGWSVDHAANGSIAVEMALRGKYDAVLMDIQMPILDGYEAARAIRSAEASEGLRRLPIIAVTAYAMSEDDKKCFDAGMDGYISKPVEAEAFFDLIERFAVPGDAK